MAGSPIFSVNFTNRKSSAVLNYHKSWSWSNQLVLWDFYVMFLPRFCWSRVFGHSLPFSAQSVAWQATFDVITSSPFVRPLWKTGGKSLYALVPFWSWNTLQHYLVDVMMKQKSFLVQGNLNFALMYRNNIEFSVFVLCHWVDCEIYWEYRTAGHLVFWKLWPAVELKKVSSVTKHGFVFWAQRKPNTRLEIYKAFQDRLTCLNRHMIVEIS